MSPYFVILYHHIISFFHCYIFLFDIPLYSFSPLKLQMVLCHICSCVSYLCYCVYYHYYYITFPARYFEPKVKGKDQHFYFFPREVDMKAHFYYFFSYINTSFKFYFSGFYYFYLIAVSTQFFIVFDFELGLDCFMCIMLSVKVVGVLLTYKKCYKIHFKLFQSFLLLV